MKSINYFRPDLTQFFTTDELARNYLASTMAPDYNTAGFMQGNLVRLTLGGYLYEQPGIIKSLTFGVPQESPWEIALSETGGSDKSVKELPHMIKVTGMTFIPIQKFIPAKEVKYAFIFGNEVDGISDDIISVSDEVVEIPQVGTKHSLNVSVAAGIVLWDFFYKTEI
jgi:hypothetical protein